MAARTGMTVALLCWRATMRRTWRQATVLALVGGLLGAVALPEAGKAIIDMVSKALLWLDRQIELLASPAQQRAAPAPPAIDREIDRAEQLPLKRLPVFAESFDLDAVETVCGFGGIDPSEPPERFTRPGFRRAVARHRGVHHQGSGVGSGLNRAR